MIRLRCIYCSQQIKEEEFCKPVRVNGILELAHPDCKEEMVEQPLDYFRGYEPLNPNEPD